MVLFVVVVNDGGGVGGVDDGVGGVRLQRGHLRRRHEATAPSSGSVLLLVL